MKKTLAAALAVGLLSLSGAAAQAQNLLTNGSLDVTYQQEITPGFFLPKPANWINEGTRVITGPFEDELSSEPWAGPTPTPVTTEGDMGSDWGVFFKGFSGNATNGAATGHLYQDKPATPGLTYILTGWAGAEAAFTTAGAEIALEFLNSGGSVIGGSGQVVNLLPTLFVDNGLNFDYKQYSATAVAPAGAISVRSRVSMIGATPAVSGGQAFVVDDFALRAVPEPSSLGLAGVALVALLARRKRAGVA